ncbi:MAG: hypothetical protein EBT92_17585 [Planctomycetes bacterium]|nr:hypothetical protein [Planctomycetota bacterium]
MKIKFKQDVELQIVVDFDQETDQPDYETVTFLQDDETDIDICDASEPLLAREIQFGDGSVAFVTPDFWSVVEIL